MDLDIMPLSAWAGSDIRPLIIAGPCSAESEEQVFKTCSELKQKNVSIFRAGIWKPRTRPNSFEGYGEKALPWIQNVQKELGIPFIIEVASPEHIELALKYDIKMFWIGARTTVNPFNVQALADALRGVDVPLLIKNPVNPDLSLWIGAIERIYQAGLKKIAVIHRGFSALHKSKYRNEPMWQLALELKTEIPNIPIIGDPSHIAGKREYLLELAQRALDLNFDGLMIESHINPDVALSDAAQQVTPTDFYQLLSNLKYRIVRAESENAFFINQLDQIRQQIDSADRELIEILKTRMALVEKACEYKIENNVTIFQVERWNEIFRSRSEWAKKMQLNPEFISEIYKLIHIESIKQHTELMSKTKV
ncbi:MAG: 3-deoxy-7-phosphoheptulonate synthase [Cytophagia bacterium]|nr:MAG: 3-deoxy-7-phosphoheptulonate synthase [Cytophagales bacterium]TAG07400.1 MAG: 3-deoxy-7-phosphoheptulonate synthase [Cytophagia bacterium]TAH30653.1 MAG: 3-deoxy-7-phosphoheptulonate synthase [Cytophagales bacterium]